MTQTCRTEMETYKLESGSPPPKCGPKKWCVFCLCSNLFSVLVCWLCVSILPNLALGAEHLHTKESGSMETRNSSTGPCTLSRTLHLITSLAFQLSSTFLSFPQFTSFCFGLSQKFTYFLRALAFVSKVRTDFAAKMEQFPCSLPFMHTNASQLLPFRTLIFCFVRFWPTFLLGRSGKNIEVDL